MAGPCGGKILERLQDVAGSVIWGRLLSVDLGERGGIELWSALIDGARLAVLLAFVVGRRKGGGVASPELADQTPPKSLAPSVASRALRVKRPLPLANGFRYAVAAGQWL